MATGPGFVLYTYETVGGQLVCHAYTTDAEAEPLTQEAAQEGGSRLSAAAAAAGSRLGTMVIPAESLPT